MLINRKKYKNKKVQHMYNIYTSFVKDRKQERKRIKKDIEPELQNEEKEQRKVMLWSLPRMHQWFYVIKE